MSGKFTVNEDWIRKNVLSNPTVASALNAKARRLAPIVKRIALKEGDKRYADHTPASSSVTNRPRKRNTAADCRKKASYAARSRRWGIDACSCKDNGHTRSHCSSHG